MAYLQFDKDTRTISFYDPASRETVAILSVGDEIGFAYWPTSSWATVPRQVGYSPIAKINGYGHITLENGMVFNKYGEERGCKYGGRTLSLADELRAIMDRDARRRGQTAAVTAVTDFVAGKRNGLGQYRFTAEDKEALAALVAAIETDI